MSSGSRQSRAESTENAHRNRRFNGFRKVHARCASGFEYSIPHTELDNLHWLPDWKERTNAEFRELVDLETQQPDWVIDGGYSVVRDLVWGRADVIVWLNYPFVTTAWQLVRRTIQRNTKKVPCCNGNYESLKRSLGHDSILLWLLKTYWKNRRGFPRALKQYSGARHVLLRSPAETSRWLEASNPTHKR